MSPTLRGYAQVAAAAVLWGTLGPAARSLFASGLTPLEGATWRATGAFVLLLVYSLLQDRRALRVAWRDLLLFAAYGAVSVAGFMTVYFTAISLTTVATAAVLLYTAPAWVVVLARVFFGEPMTPMKAAAVGLSFAGCVLVTGAFGGSAVRPTAGGVLAGLGAGLTYALYSIFGKAALRRHSPLTTVVFATGFGALFLAVAAGGLPRLTAASLPPLGYTVVFPTAAAYLLYIGGLRWVEAGRASIIATLEPVVAAAAGALVLHEAFGVVQWIGAALVLAGVVLVQGEQVVRRSNHPP
ncbi:MAG: EamA family transporter [Armatimonadota bacterium]|nr:EamA family transporter [Armatimonadota bacterium]MDR7519106.1 EamA family transporter [Armatimonadota bacterium]